MDGHAQARAGPSGSAGQAQQASGSGSGSGSAQAQPQAPAQAQAQSSDAWDDLPAPADGDLEWLGRHFDAGFGAAAPNGGATSGNGGANTNTASTAHAQPDAQASAAASTSKLPAQPSHGQRQAHDMSLSSDGPGFGREGAGGAHGGAHDNGAHDNGAHDNGTHDDGMDDDEEEEPDRSRTPSPILGSAHVFASPGSARPLLRAAHAGASNGAGPSAAAGTSASATAGTSTSIQAHARRLSARAAFLSPQTDGGGGAEWADGQSAFGADTDWEYEYDLEGEYGGDAEAERRASATEYGHLSFPAGSALLAGPTTEELRLFTADPAALSQDLASALAQAQDEKLRDEEARQVQRIQHALKAAGMGEGSPEAEALSALAARAALRGSALCELSAYLSRVQLGALSALSATRAGLHRALHAERARGALERAEAAALRQQAALLAVRLHRAESRYERLVGEKKEEIVRLFDEGLRNGSAAVAGLGIDTSPALPASAGSQRRKSRSGAQLASIGGSSPSKQPQQAAAEGVAAAGAAAGPSAGASAAAETTSPTQQQHARDSDAMLLSSPAVPPPPPAQAQGSAQAAAQGHGHGQADGPPSSPVLATPLQERATPMQERAGDASLQSSPITEMGPPAADKGKGVDRGDDPFIERPTTPPFSPLLSLVKERNKLLSDKRYLKARVKDSEAQLGRLEHELHTLRSFLVRSEGKRIAGGGGTAIALWNAAAIPDGPAGSRHRARERARKKKLAVMGDAETELLLAAAKTIREKERRIEQEAKDREEREEEEIRRAVAAAANPPLPVKPRPARAPKQGQGQPQTLPLQSPVQPFQSPVQPHMVPMPHPQQQPLLPPQQRTPRLDTAAAAAMMGGHRVRHSADFGLGVGIGLSNMDAHGHGLGHAPQLLPPHSGSPILASRTVPHTPELGASLRMSGARTPQTPRSAHLLGAITGAGPGASSAGPPVSGAPAAAAVPGGGAGRRPQQAVSSLRDDEGGSGSVAGTPNSNASAYASSGIDGLLQAAQLVTPGGTRISHPPSSARSTGGAHHERPEEDDEYYPKGARTGFGGTALDEAALSFRGSPKRRRVASGELELQQPHAHHASGSGSPRLNGRRVRTSTAPETHLPFNAAAGEDSGAPPASQLSALDLLADQAAASQHPSQSSDWSNSEEEETRTSNARANANAGSNAMQVDRKAEVHTPIMSHQAQQSANAAAAARATQSAPGKSRTTSMGSPVKIGQKLKRGTEVPKEKRVPYIRWTDPEDRKLRAAIKEYGQRWELISRAVGTRSYHQCRQRYLLMRRKEAAQLGHSLANHPRLDADRVGPHYEEPQFETYIEGEEDNGEDEEEDDDEELEFADDQQARRHSASAALHHARRKSSDAGRSVHAMQSHGHGARAYADAAADGDTTIRHAGHGMPPAAPGASTSAIDDEEDELAFDDGPSVLAYKSAVMPTNHRTRSLSLATG